MSLHEIKCGPIPPTVRRRALGSIVQKIPLSYAWNGEPDSYFGWWWTPAEDQAWEMPNEPEWQASLTLDKDGKKLNFVCKSGYPEDDIDHQSDVTITDGPIVVIRKRWYILREEQSNLPLLGLTVFTTRRADGVVFQTFRFNNGIAGLSRPFRFSKLAITLFKTNVDLRSPKSGTSLRARYAEGSPVPHHAEVVLCEGAEYFPTRGILTTEIASFKSEEQRTIAMDHWDGRDLVIFPDQVAFGPLKSSPAPRPTRVSFSSHLDSIRTALRGGTRYGGADGLDSVADASAGVWRFAGHNAPYTHGGQGIDMGLGWELDSHAAIVHVEQHRLIMERMWVGNVSVYDGHPLRDDELFVQQGYDHSRSGGPTAELPAFRGPLFNPDAPPAQYESMFDESKDAAMHRIDDAHLIRALRHGINAWWLCADFAAREDLIQIAEDAAYGEWSAIGVAPYKPQYEGQWISPSLESKLVSASENQHKGGWLGRAFGWTMAARAVLHCLTRNKAEREIGRRWADKAIHLAIVSSHPAYGWTQNASWTWTSPMPETETGIQSFEWAIVAHGLGCIALSMYMRRSRKFARIAKLIDVGCNALYVRIPPVPAMYGGVGPPKFVASYRYGRALWESPPPGYPVTGEDHAGDPTHVFHALAVWIKTSEDPKLMSPAIAVAIATQWVPHESVADAYAWMKLFEDAASRPWISELEGVLSRNPRFLEDSF